MEEATSSNMKSWLLSTGSLTTVGLKIIAWFGSAPAVIGGHFPPSLLIPQVNNWPFSFSASVLKNSASNFFHSPEEQYWMVAIVSPTWAFSETSITWPGSILKQSVLLWA